MGKKSIVKPKEAPENVEMEGVEIAEGNENPLSDPASPGEFEDEEDEEELFDGEEFVSGSDEEAEEASEGFSDDDDEDGNDEDIDMDDGGADIPLGFAADNNGVMDEDEDEEANDMHATTAATDTNAPAKTTSIPPSLSSYPITSNFAGAGGISAAAGGDASLDPQKAIPYTHDAGHLLISDGNPLPLAPGASGREVEQVLESVARDAAQSLIAHLLTTCPIRTSSSSGASGVEMVLPPPSFPIPREKPAPKPKAATKWDLFARRKGIGKYAGHQGGKANAADAQGRLKADGGKMVYDESTGEWVRKWGYKGKNKDGESDWLVELDEKKSAGAGASDPKGAKGARAATTDAVDPRSLKRQDRKDRVKRNERAMRANERRQRKKP